MECPKCGYAMSDFDAECPRCRNIEKQKQAKAEAQTSPVPQASPQSSGPIRPTPAAVPTTPSTGGSKAFFGCIVAAVVLILSGVMCSSCMTPEKDKYTDAQYDQFLTSLNQSISGSGLQYGKDYTVEWGGGGSHGILKITLNQITGTPRQYKDIADGLATSYRKWFPLNGGVYVIIKDYQQMKTVYEDIYSWK